MTVTKSFEIDLSAEEIALLFCDMDSWGQARFFSEVWRISRDWPGAGWCQQSSYIISDLPSEGMSAVETLAGHLPAATLERLHKDALSC